MSIIYLASLVGVSIAILCLLGDALVSVSRRPRWQSSFSRTLVLVASNDRREHGMPFVGADRRRAGDETNSEPSRRAA